MRKASCVVAAFRYSDHGSYPPPETVVVGVNFSCDKELYLLCFPLFSFQQLFWMVRDEDFLLFSPPVLLLLTRSACSTLGIYSIYSFAYSSFRLEIYLQNVCSLAILLLKEQNWWFTTCHMTSSLCCRGKLNCIR